MSIPDNFEDETIGEDLASLLSGSHGEQVANVLPGCGYYREDPDDIEVITGCDHTTRQLLVFKAGVTRRVGLSGAYILHGPVQRAVFETALSPDERAGREWRTAIAAFGYTGRVDHCDLRSLAEALQQAKSGPLPGRQGRTSALALAEKYDPQRLTERLCKAWLFHGDGPPPGDTVIALVAVLRHSGRTTEALARTDMLLAADHGLSEGERGVLLTQRAALWLDRFEQTNDAILLDRAQRSAAQSWRIAPSDACSLVYRRLEKLRE